MTPGAPAGAPGPAGPEGAVGAATPAVVFRGLHKTFGGVVALHHVDFAVERGTCHGLMGENGAGKSTLGRILAGITAPDWGELIVDGAPRRFAAPADALAAGVGMVHQELAFCPELSVAENLSLGRWPRRRGRVDRAALRARARALLARLGADLDVDQPLGRLSTADEQRVQIAAAVGTGARILVFDEPTSSLSEGEARRLFGLIEELVADGLTVLYVSHRLPEVERLCDRVTVLRDGRVVDTVERGDFDTDRIVRLMIGRDLESRRPRHLDATPGEVRLEVAGLSSPGVLADVSLTVRAGEIVGLAGLVGAGRSELARALFGLDPGATGRVVVDGRPLRLGAQGDALAAGLVLVPEDRKRQGLVPGLSGRANWSLGGLRRFRRGWGGLRLVDRGQERRAARAAYGRFGVRAPSVETPVSALSGGNQQKVVLARWLATAAGVLLVDEPTRGVDVGAKAAIHDMLDERARAGSALLLISSDLPELLHLSSRVVVLRAGRVAGALARARADEESVMRLMAGLADPAAA